MFLNLSPSFNPFGAAAHEQIGFEAFTFPGGEPHIKIGNPDRVGEVANGHIKISIQLCSMHALGYLCVAVDALRRCGMKSFDLCIPYFPAARQDRVMTAGEPLTVKIFADAINALHANRVIILDPHSSVAPALLSHVEVVDNHQFVRECLAQIPHDVCLVSPDAGAEKKIHELAQVLDYEEDRIVFCSKKRDVRTGALSGFEVLEDDLDGRSCLIVDDICDGGGTFLGLAEKLKEKGADALYLAVSHGIFSKGLEVLNQQFEHVFTTDSFPQRQVEEGLTVVPFDIMNAEYSFA
ncbi:MAG: ribose-phosphate diphosphokinase [Bacteroidia bacterium]